MNRVLKTLLIWILMAVLPLNAGAAAVGISCTHGHQQTMQVALSHTVHEHDGARHAPGLGADGMQAHTDASTVDQPDSPHAACSACSAFCMGAAAPPPVAASLPSLSGAEDVFVPAAPRVSGFIPEGLRRPPRQIPA
jgi:hypothetical protein